MDHEAILERLLSPVGVMKLDYQLGIMMVSYGIIILCGILWDDYGI